MALPLLIKGFSANKNGSSDSTIAVAATPVTWNNVLPEQRGNLIALDVVATNADNTNWQDITTINLGWFNLLIGSMQVLTAQRLVDYLVTSRPRSYELLSLEQKAGQTMQFELNPETTIGAVVHAYFQNQYATREVIAARQNSVLKQRILGVTQIFAAGQRFQRGNSITVPTAQGNVVAIELSCVTDIQELQLLSISKLSVYVNGESVIEEAATVLFIPMSGRPGLIFPIVIRPGSTISIEVDTLNTGAIPEKLHATLKLYFDDDLTGKKRYA